MRYVHVPRAEREALARGDYREAVRLLRMGLGLETRNVTEPKSEGCPAKQIRTRGVRFTDEDIRRIRLSEEPDTVIARANGVSVSLVGRIRRRESYRWVN